jgi:CHRD domain-containing protein
MRKLPILSVAFAVVLVAPAVIADSTLHAKLTGYEETPAAISTAASGSFRAKINQDNTIDYELSYENLEGDVTQSHIHFGRPGTSGGIAVWLCQGLTAGPVGTPNCEGARTGGATGTLTPASVIGPAGQGIAAGEWDEFVAAIRDGSTYVNVHSSLRTGGEIRGVLR